MNKFEIVRGLISQQEAERLHKYLILRRKAATYLKETKHFEDKQVPNTFSLYGDPIMETYLQELKPKFEASVGANLTETYAYCRLYQQGDVLTKHKDRSSCEISTTMFLGGQVWPIYFEPDVEVVLQQGDAVIYRGCDVEHWRDELKGYMCSQVFFHYSENKKSLYDGRTVLGVPKDA
jgi:hypothetical protein